MSTEINIVYGFGFPINELKPENFINFIEKRKENFMKAIDDEEIVDDFFHTKEDFKTLNELDSFFYEYDYACDISNERGVGAVISNIMQMETGIGFRYENETIYKNNKFILFPEMMPWQFNEVESKLSLQNLEDICKQYMDELGFRKSDYKDYPDYIQVEYSC